MIVSPVQRTGRLSVLVVVLTLASAASAPVALADLFVFELHHGGRIEGDWLNLHDKPLKNYQIKTAEGGEVLLAASQVSRRIRRRPEQIEYDRIAPLYMDTVEAQWRLAQWCRERRLVNERKAHLERIIELDPHHTAARRGLGYTQIGNQWLTRDDWRKAQGYVFYRGRWRMEQEIDLLEASSKRDRNEREWLATLKRIRSALETDRRSDAYNELLAIRDPHAVRALKENLREERSRRIKFLYIDALGNINSSDAVLALINTSMNDPDVEIFHATIEKIVELKPSYAVHAYIKGLSNANNVRVNRAAYALGEIGEQQAMAPLIDALVTTHQIVIAPANGGSPTATFARPQQCNDGTPANPFGSTTLTAGGKPQVISRRVPNQEALHALVKLSGGSSFGFDQTAWKNWLALERQRTQSLSSLRN